MDRYYLTIRIYIVTISIDITGGIKMPDYEKMYLILFNKVTDIINELQEVQKVTEGIYIEPNLQIVVEKEKSSEKGEADEV